MSAESPRKSNRQGSYIVAPQPVTDRSIIESVAGFINDVVPQGYSSPGVDSKETVITWARFEQADINDPGLYPDSIDEPTRAPPLLLILGYANGVQVWAVPASGEATEVLSWRQGVVRTLRILPSPPSGDSFAHKRPLVALCDTASPGPQFCSLSFISLRVGDQVKSIKFKNPVMAVLANIRCIVVTFLERIAVFDACTLEDRFTVTTCYPSPGVNVNPVALGSRWLAYAERKLCPAKRCSGGTEGEGIQSYTATVLHAAKSLSKGLRELGETVASSLTGGATPPGVRVPGGLPDNDFLNPGIVTVLDIQGTPKDNGRVEENVVAHFSAHGDAIVAMQFDPSGMLLATADKRGHDFHVFRIQPHPGGSSLAAVHHLYVLHRGDTTAKVQDLVFAWDSRWLAVSTLRGTTHVFPVTPYGGAVGLRTHSTPHVVNRLSRFHRSAGLTADGRNSPQPCEGGGCSPHHPAMAHANPRLPPYPHPTVVTPLAQIRQSQPTPAPAPGRSPGTRRSHALDESGTVPLRVSACFGAPRAWLVGSPTAPRDSSTRARRRAVDSLFVMACHGNLIQYDLETKHASGIPREKVCDDTPIELDVEAKAQWTLGGLLRMGGEVQPPLPPTSLLIAPPVVAPVHTADQSDERWLSQVEIVTHAGPHRRLWMGPQFTFKTVEPDGPSSRLVRSNPVNMPQPPAVPVLIESGSGSSYEQSPHLIEAYGNSGDGSDGSGGPGDIRLREDLADAMLESPGIANRHTGRRVIVEICSGKRNQAIPIEKIVNPVGSVLTVLTDEGCADGVTGDPESEEATVRWPTDVIKMPNEDDPSSCNKSKFETAKQNSKKGQLNATDTHDRSEICDAMPSMAGEEVPAESCSSLTKVRNQGSTRKPVEGDKIRSKKKAVCKEKDRSYVDLSDSSSVKASTKEIDIVSLQASSTLEKTKAPSERTVNIECFESKTNIQQHPASTSEPTLKATKKQGKKAVGKKIDQEPLEDFIADVEPLSARGAFTSTFSDCLKEESLGGKKCDSLSADLLAKVVLETESVERSRQEFPELKSDKKITVNSKDKSYKEKKSRSPFKSKVSIATKDDSELYISCIEGSKEEMVAAEDDIGHEKLGPELETQNKTDSRSTSRARKYQGLDFIDINHSIQETNLKCGSKKKLKMFELPEGPLMETGDSSDLFPPKEKVAYPLECIDSLMPTLSTSLVPCTNDLSPLCNLVDKSTIDTSERVLHTNNNSLEHCIITTAITNAISSAIQVTDDMTIPDTDSSATLSRLDTTQSTSYTSPLLSAESATPTSRESLSSVWNDSPSISWSNVASGKKREEVLPVKSWSTVVKSFSADNGVTSPVEVKPIENHTETGVPMEEEDEAPSSLQASKKNRKVKKKRR